MKIFLNRPRTMSHKLREGPDILTLHPIPVTHSDGALQNLQSAFMHFASFELQSNLWIRQVDVTPILQMWKCGWHNSSSQRNAWCWNGAWPGPLLGQLRGVTKRWIVSDVSCLNIGLLIPTSVPSGEWKQTAELRVLTSVNAFFSLCSI